MLKLEALSQAHNATAVIIVFMLIAPIGLAALVQAAYFVA